MGWFTDIVVYLTIWWTVLFAVLPLGTTTYHEAGVAPPRGCEPGAPMDPKLKKKFITTSWVSAIVFAALWLVVTFHLVPVPKIPGSP